MVFESVSEAAKRHGVTTRTIQKRIKSGKIRGAVLVGNSYAVPVPGTEGIDTDSIERKEKVPFPLINGRFAPGESQKYISGITDPVIHDIAMAERFYFTGQNRRAMEIIERYIQHSDRSISLSASILYTFVTLSLEKTHQSEIGLSTIKKAVTDILKNSQDKKERAYAIMIATAQAVLLHKPIPDVPLLRGVLRDLPEGVRQFAAYILAHKAFLQKNYERTIAICDTVLHYSEQVCPLPAIHLNLIGSIALLYMKRTEEAKGRFLCAYELARYDDFIQPFAENHMLLGGLAEVCLKYDHPEDFKRLVEITRSYVPSWSRVHNREMNASVTDLLSTTEFTVAMLYNQSWSIKEIAVHLALSERMIKYHISTIYDKLGISSREELRRYMIN